MYHTMQTWKNRKREEWAGQFDENKYAAKVDWIDCMRKFREFYISMPTGTAIHKADFPVEIQTLVNNKFEARNKEFMDFLVGILGAIKPVMKEGKVDTIETIKSVQNNTIEYKDTEYPPEDVITVVQFLRDVSWSHFNKESQSHGGKFNSGVPMFLYAQRLYNSIPYSDWQLEDHALQVKYYPYILGKALGNLPREIKLVSAPPVKDDLIDHNGAYCVSKLCRWYDIDAAKSRKNKSKEEGEIMDFEEIRLQATTGRKRGIMMPQPPTEYRCNSTTADYYFNKAPKLYRMMLMQLWIFNSQIRNKNMILDWWDWDNIPDPLDVSSNSYKNNDAVDDIGY